LLDRLVDESCMLRSFSVPVIGTHSLQPLLQPVFICDRGEECVSDGGYSLTTGSPCINAGVDVEVERYGSGVWISAGSDYNYSHDRGSVLHPNIGADE